MSSGLHYADLSSVCIVEIWINLNEVVNLTLCYYTQCAAIHSRHLLDSRPISFKENFS